jgi:transcriptional regulator with XRE-family HTH domain
LDPRPKNFQFVFAPPVRPDSPIQEKRTMATVHYSTDCHDGFDDSDDAFNDPLAVADSGHSEVVRAASESGATATPRPGQRPQRQLHRIAQVRQQQGVTLRNVSRRLGIELSVVRRQEQADCDLRLSDLHRWQQVLEVPVSELLVEGDGQLSGPVLERSRMVKLMKTAAAIRERTGGTPVGRTVEMLIEQILEIMPELEDVTPWHSVGQRRTLDDIGRTGRHILSEDDFRRPQQ